MLDCIAAVGLICGSRDTVQNTKISLALALNKYDLGLGLEKIVFVLVFSKSLYLHQFIKLHASATKRPTPDKSPDLTNSCRKAAIK